MGPDGAVYLSTNAGIEVIKNGKRVWNYTFPYVAQNSGYYVTASPPALDQYGNIYVGVEQEQRLYAFKPDGENNWTVNWTYSIERYWGFSPILLDGNGHLFVGTDWEMLALTTSGHKLWNLSVGLPYFSERPSIYGSTVYFVRHNSGGTVDRAQLYAVDLSNGNILWNYSVSSEIVSVPMVSNNGTVYFLVSDGTPVKNGYLYGVENNMTVMKVRVGNTPGSLAMDKAGYIYASGDSHLYSWYPNGTLRWQMNLSGFIRNFVLDSRGNIFPFMYKESSQEWELLSISPDRQIRWNVSVAAYDQHTFEPVIGPDGTISVATDYYGNFMAIGEKQGFNNTGTGGTGNGTNGTSGGNTSGEQGTNGSSENGENTGNSGGTGSTPGFEAIAMIASIGIVAYIWKRKTI